MNDNEEWRKHQKEDSYKINVAALIGIIICLSISFILELITK